MKGMNDIIEGQKEIVRLSRYVLTTADVAADI